MLFSQLCVGQCSDDLFEKRCLYYQKQYDSAHYPAASLEHEHIQTEVQEMFVGHFDSIRVFMLHRKHMFIVDKDKDLYISDHFSMSHCVQVLNATSAEQIKVYDLNDFNSAFGSSTTTSNLDIAYLYMFLVLNIQYELTLPRVYRKSLIRNSEFLTHESSVFNKGVGVLIQRSISMQKRMHRALIEEYVDQSYKYEIYIFRITEDTTYRYEFLFKEPSILKDVSVTVFPYSEYRPD